MSQIMSRRNHWHCHSPRVAERGESTCGSLWYYQEWRKATVKLQS